MFRFCSDVVPLLFRFWSDLVPMLFTTLSWARYERGHCAQRGALGVAYAFGAGAQQTAADTSEALNVGAQSPWSEERERERERLHTYNVCHNSIRSGRKRSVRACMREEKCEVKPHTGDRTPRTRKRIFRFQLTTGQARRRR